MPIEIDGLHINSMVIFHGYVKQPAYLLHLVIYSLIVYFYNYSCNYINCIV